MTRPLLLLALVACAKGPDAPVAAQRVGAVPLDAPLPPDDAPAAPASPLEARLRARHVADLPSVTDLRAWPGAEAELTRLAQEGGASVVALRALDLLGAFPTSRDVLVGVLADTTAPDARRLAAATGLGRLDLTTDTVAREALLGAVVGPNERVAVEAVGVLRGQAGTEAALREVVARGPVSEAVRAAVGAP
jgi:hypothetical protein